MPKPKPIPMDKSAIVADSTTGVKPRLLMAPVTTRPNSNRPDSEVLGNRYDGGITDDEYYDDDDDDDDDNNKHAEGSSGESTPTADAHSESPRCPSSQSSIESFHDAQEKEQEDKKRMSRTASTISATSVQLQLLSSRASGSAIYFGCHTNDAASHGDEKLTPHPLRISKSPTMHVSSPSTSTGATTTLPNTTDPATAHHGTGFRLSRPTSVYYPSNPFSLSRASSLTRRSHPAPTPSASDLAFLPAAPSPTALTSLTTPEAQAVMRFNAQLYGFKDILYSHIEDVNTAIAATEEMQKERKENCAKGGVRKGVMFEDSVDAEGVKRRRRERVEKLRRDGWRGERFWGKRYQRVAERAEAELVGRGAEAA